MRFFPAEAAVILLVASGLSSSMAAPPLTTNPAVASLQRTRTPTPTQTRPRFLTATTARQVPVTRPTPSFHLPTESPRRSRPTKQERQAQQSITIALVVLASLVATSFLVFLLRCAFRIKHVPKRDRVAEIIARHNLQSELAELERNPAVLRRPSLREPAPPYMPRPPSYVDTISRPYEASSQMRGQYAEVPMHSPPSTPPPIAVTTLPIHPSRTG
jgi:hypothetical protein